MFLRNLVVIVVPLLLTALLAIICPMLASLGFWSNVLIGLLLGVSLALLLPLAGASRRREPFTGMLWIPLLVLLAVVAVQYLESRGIEVPVMGLFRTGEPAVVLVECAFIGYMAVQLLRTKK